MSSHCRRTSSVHRKFDPLTKHAIFFPSFDKAPHLYRTRLLPVRTPEDPIYVFDLSSSKVDLVFLIFFPELFLPTHSPTSNNPPVTDGSIPQPSEIKNSPPLCISLALYYFEWDRWGTSCLTYTSRTTGLRVHPLLLLPNPLSISLIPDPHQHSYQSFSSTTFSGVTVILTID